MGLTFITAPPALSPSNLPSRKPRRAIVLRTLGMVDGFLQLLHWR